MQSNDEQIEFWNGEAGEKWVSQQQVMDATLQPVSDALLARANAQSGEVALDVGCGCGDTSLALAKAGLSVTGVDISEPMLAHARTRVEDKQTVQFVQADASRAEFSDQFDLLLSRFGVMFFDDPTAAFANLHKHMNSGGRLCFVCWQPPKRNAWISAPMMAAKELLPESAPMDPHAPGPFAFADAERTQRILEDAGWRDVQIEDVPWSMKMGETAEEAMRFATQIGPLASALRELPDKDKSAITDKVLAVLQPFESTGGVLLDAASWVVTANA
ncbi:MAG: class I SAM-dependent methyltransferase [Pseudomonadales bacterium]